MKAIDLNGQTFGSWEVLGEGPSTPHKNTKRKNWSCRCTKCGFEFYKPTDTVRFNVDDFCRNCHPMFVFHGLRDHPLYGVHQGMRGRCSNKDNRWKQWYYDRGIRVCPEWDGSKGFLAFYEWAIDKWAPGLEIDRIDNDKGYSPDNCHFVLHADNIRNNSLTHRYLINGTEILSKVDAVERFSCVGKNEVNKRIKRGMSLLEAYTTPPEKNGRKTPPTEILVSIEPLFTPEPPSIKYMDEGTQQSYRKIYG